MRCNLVASFPINIILHCVSLQDKDCHDVLTDGGGCAVTIDNSPEGALS